jgi:ornithine decarboxylase
MSILAIPTYFSQVSKALEEIQPNIPVYIMKRHILEEKVKTFSAIFQGRVLYSVKSNPCEKILTTLYSLGIKHFDVASIKEVELLRRILPQAVLYYMHPVKSASSIRDAYFNHNVKIFSLDSIEELHKIYKATNNAKDLSLHVRIATENKSSAFNLSSKFGIDLDKAYELLIETRKLASQFGICFHVGSQCLDAHAFNQTLSRLSSYLIEKKISIDVVDIGGGFPVRYPEMIPMNLNIYLDKVNSAINTFREVFPRCDVWAEPGRVLVAEAGSLVVRVDRRKDNVLYINDGVYGGLFDAGTPAFRYHATAYRGSPNKGETLSQDNVMFSFYGPTCDCLDYMEGPFILPKNIKEGDYIELHNLGAYSKSLRTNFNGFYDYLELDL